MTCKPSRVPHSSLTFQPDSPYAPSVCSPRPLLRMVTSNPKHRYPSSRSQLEPDHQGVHLISRINRKWRKYLCTVGRDTIKLRHRTLHCVYHTLKISYKARKQKDTNARVRALLSVAAIKSRWRFFFPASLTPTHAHLRGTRYTQSCPRAYP